MSIQKQLSRYTESLTDEQITQIILGQTPLFDEFMRLGAITVPERFGIDFLLGQSQQDFRQGISVAGYPLSSYYQSRTLVPGEMFLVYSARCQQFPLPPVKLEVYTEQNGFTFTGSLGNLLVLTQLAHTLFRGVVYRTTDIPHTDNGETEFDSEILVSEYDPPLLYWVQRDDVIQKGRLFLFFKKIK